MAMNVRAVLAALLIAALGGPRFVAADTPEFFPKRGERERLSLSYATIHAGATKPFSLLHASDTHLTSAYDDEGEKKTTLRDIQTKAFGGRQQEALRDTLDWARDHVNLMVHTGDLIDFQSRANFDAVREAFSNAPAIFGCLGNHDFNPDLWLNDPKENGTEAWKDRTRDTLRQVYPFDISLQSRIVNGVNFVALDNVFGVVTAAQVERFKAEVAKGLPIILCVHVPFYTDELWRATRMFWAKPGPRFTEATVPVSSGERLSQERDQVTRDFIAYLKSEPLLKAILAGHLHFSAEERFSPTAMQYVTGGNYLFCARMVLVL